MSGDTAETTVRGAASTQVEAPLDTPGAEPASAPLADPASQVLAPTAEQPASVMQAILHVANDPRTDVAKFESLLNMYKDLDHRRAELAFNKAMNAAQAEMRRVVPDCDNQQTRSRYPSYAALDRALRPIYSKHGFSLSFDTGETALENTVLVLCYVAHSDGFTRTYRTLMPADGKGAKGGDVMTRTHAAGSAMSYGMRYLIKLIFNVAVGEDDDDGNGANGPDTPQVERISEQEAADIESLISEVGADRDAFLDYFRMTRVSDLTKQAKPDAIRMLRKVGERNARKEQRR